MTFDSLHLYDMHISSGYFRFRYEAVFIWSYLCCVSGVKPYNTLTPSSQFVICECDTVRISRRAVGTARSTGLARVSLSFPRPLWATYSMAVVALSNCFLSVSRRRVASDPDVPLAGQPEAGNNLRVKIFPSSIDPVRLCVDFPRFVVFAGGSPSSSNLSHSHIEDQAWWSTIKTLTFNFFWDANLFFCAR